MHGTAGWLIWFGAAALASVWALHIRRRAFLPEGVTRTKIHRTLLLTCGVLAVPLTGITPAHVLWIGPLAWFWGGLSTRFPLRAFNAVGFGFAMLCCWGAAPHSEQ